MVCCRNYIVNREHDNLNRSLTVEEAREVTRIAALLLLEKALDVNYLNSKTKAPK